MFYMDNAKMLFGDAKVSCDGKLAESTHSLLTPWLTIPKLSRLQ